MEFYKPWMVFSAILSIGVAGKEGERAHFWRAVFWLILAFAQVFAAFNIN